MKKFLTYLLLAVSLAAIAPSFSGCSTPPDQRTIMVRSLIATGVTAKTYLDSCAQMLKNGEITVAQYERVADLYDHRFLPAYSTAALAVKGDLSSPVTPDVAAIVVELANLIVEYKKYKL